MKEKLSDDKLKFFADFIFKELGIVFEKDNFFQLEDRLDEITKNLGVPNKETLWQKATKEGITGHFRQLLLDVATNNETSFFRDKKMFDVLKKGLFDQLFDKVVGRPFKIWSAACSFGQEPYTLAILLDQMGQKDPKFLNYTLLATDISQKALEKASAGSFGQLEVQRGLPINLLIKYFKKDEKNYWHIRPELKTKITFQSLNLLKIFGLVGNFDLIFCRNVLIYQKPDKKLEILKNIGMYLRPGGLLVLGGAETIDGLKNVYESEIIEGALFFRKKGL